MKKIQLFMVEIILCSRLKPNSVSSGMRIKDNRRKISILLVIAVVIWGTVGIPICYKFVWSPLSSVPLSKVVQHQEGNVPIVSEINSFIVEEFHIQQKVTVDSEDSLHTVYVYMKDTLCNDLPTTTTFYVHNETSPPPSIPVYMMKGSHISLNASASTKGPDNNPIVFYVLRTVEDYFTFNPHNPPKKGYRKHIPVGNDGVSRQTNFSQPISTSDYYSIRFEGDLNTIDLSYSLLIKIKRIDIDAVNATPIGILYPKSGFKIINESLRFGTEKYCVFADIEESSSRYIHNSTALETRMEPRVLAGATITACTLFAFFIIILVTETLIYSLYVTFFKRRDYTTLE